VRIDFGGGWTDVPPYSDEMGGYVCNVAIARYATVNVRCGTTDAPLRDEQYIADRSITDAALKRFDMPDAHLSVTSDFPVGAGLGGSSAVGVATVAALTAVRGEPSDRTAIAELSRTIEIRDLGIPGGRQDHYAAAYGGALGLRFSSHGVDVQRIPMSADTRAELESRCIVLYTGQSRISGETITAVLRAYENRNERVLNALHQMRALAERMAEVLAEGDIETLATLVGEQWSYQRALHPAISTPTIDEVIARGTAAGALGAKALGASGGGCVLLIAQRGRADAVRHAVQSLGELFSFTIDVDGVSRCQ
jgi:D-glycero-alpha-D-manno-heptose-7-phosphate kinase